MSTKQPQWRRIANLGDVHPVDYGGFFVYVDRAGVYPPEVELLESPDSDDAPEGWTVSRAIIEPDPTGEWWYIHLHAVAVTHGQTLEDYQKRLTSDNVIDRASVYRDLMSYFGAHEFDSYPRTYHKRSDLPRRIRRYGE